MSGTESQIEPWVDLLLEQRWAALGTLDCRDATPFVSSVAYAVNRRSDPCLLLHLSELAAHTRNLLATEQASLLVTAPDPGRGDPQQLPRLSLKGTGVRVEPGSEEFSLLASDYVEKFPDAEMRFGLADFHLFRFLPTSGNFIGGFGAATRLTGATIRESLTQNSGGR